MSSASTLANLGVSILTAARLSGGVLESRPSGPYPLTALISRYFLQRAECQRRHHVVSSYLHAKAKTDGQNLLEM
ncbi:hypothetical protein DM02DRAFT_115065 [Periconia macrospinosa]|uniref:Uncharacterized protein n=1 Tax=Periconia macrospinosa TaxID=97972 RepID=A0A2V1DEI8_9PLEO|nr:hypothetical protein DM02DRAFT_115065 [Periconia macrospinosa]